MFVHLFDRNHEIMVDSIDNCLPVRRLAWHRPGQPRCSRGGSKAYLLPWEDGIPWGLDSFSAIHLMKKSSLLVADTSSSSLVYMSWVDLDMVGCLPESTPALPAWGQGRRSRRRRHAPVPLLLRRVVHPSGRRRQPKKMHLVWTKELKPNVTQT
jgi:hypothetical protein